MDGVKHMTTPMASDSRLSHFSGTSSFYDPHLYRSNVSASQYLTRSDIAFVVNKVSKCVQSPTEDH